MTCSISHLILINLNILKWLVRDREQRERERQRETERQSGLSGREEGRGEREEKKEGGYWEFESEEKGKENSSNW